MLHGGLSLTIFEEWCTNELNMIIMPGYCVAGTVGHKILNGTRKLEFKKGKPVEVKMSVQYMSFSAHADAKGIMQLISHCCPTNVMLVHGEAVKMEFLKAKIKQEHGIECYMPANGETAVIETPVTIPASVSTSLLREESERYDQKPPDAKRQRVLHGALVIRGDAPMQLIAGDDVCQDFDLPKYAVRFTTAVKYQSQGSVGETRTLILDLIERDLSDTDYRVSFQDGEISVSNSVMIKVEQNLDEKFTKDIMVSWSYKDENIGTHLLSLVRNLVKQPT